MTGGLLGRPQGVLSCGVRWHGPAVGGDLWNGVGACLSLAAACRGVAQEGRRVLGVKGKAVGKPSYKAYPDDNLGCLSLAPPVGVLLLPPGL